MLYVHGTTERWQLGIFGIDGRQYLVRSISGDQVISLNDIPDGLLVIRLTGRSKSQVIKLMNQK
jgi:hypothetical protein